MISDSGMLQWGTVSLSAKKSSHLFDTVSYFSLQNYLFTCKSVQVKFVSLKVSKTAFNT